MIVFGLKESKRWSNGGGGWFRIDEVREKRAKDQSKSKAKNNKSYG
jgi:hypothetical protein